MKLKKEENGAGERMKQIEMKEKKTRRKERSHLKGKKSKRNN